MSTSKTPRRTAVLTGLAAASSLVVGLLVAPPALAHPDGCQAKAGEDVDEECFTASQIAELDDSSAPLPTPGTTASSPNLRLLSNPPKTGIAAGDTAFTSDLAFVDG